MDTNTSPNVESGLIEVNGTQLYYESAGVGYPPVIFVHRGLLDNRMWDDQFAYFARDYRVIRYDIRGSGQSPRQPGDFSHYSDLLGLMDALNIPKAHLIGLALGASVCIDAAIVAPERVASLVLASPTLGGFNAPSPIFKLYQQSLFRAIGKMNPAQAADISVRMWVNGPHRRQGDVAESVSERARAMMFQALSIPPESYLPKMLQPHAIERLGEITAPTLVLLGTVDIQDTLDIADIIGEGIDQSELIGVEAAGHLLNMEQPAEFNRLVEDFLRANAS